MQRGKRAGGRLVCLPPAVSWLGGKLPSGVVDDVVSGETQLRDGNKGIAFLDQAFNDGGEGLRRVLGGIVEEDNGAWLDLGGDTAADLRGREVFPIQTVRAGSSFKALTRQRGIIGSRGE